MSSKFKLNSSQLKQFLNEGYLVVPDFFKVEELHPLMKRIEKQVEELADDLYRTKRVQNKYENEGFYTRLTKLEHEFPGAAVLLTKKGELTKELQDLWTHPKLLDVMEQILGPEVAGHPVWNLRTKTPNNPLVTVPWHQDAAYLLPDCNTFQPTAWVPLVDANKENGCMQVLKYGHQHNKLLDHVCCTGKTWYISIPTENLKEFGENCEIVTCEVPLGGVLFINQLIPHCSLENFSNKIRWSVDLRYQRPDEPSGFFGSQTPILFRTAKDPNYKPDWEGWKKNGPELNKDQTVDDNDKFSTLITGPWMKRWKIVNHNQHTDRFENNPDWSGWHKV